MYILLYYFSSEALPYHLLTSSVGDEFQVSGVVVSQEPFVYLLLRPQYSKKRNNDRCIGALAGKTKCFICKPIYH